MAPSRPFKTQDVYLIAKKGEEIMTNLLDFQISPIFMSDVEL